MLCALGAARVIISKFCHAQLVLELSPRASFSVHVDMLTAKCYGGVSTGTAHAQNGLARMQSIAAGYQSSQLSQ